MPRADPIFFGILCKNLSNDRYLVFPLQTTILLAHCPNVASLRLFSIGNTLIDVHLSWLNWFQLLILK